MTNFEMVGEFHEKFGLPTCDSLPKMISEDLFMFRYQFLQEELLELLSAYRASDLEKVADALADLEYVTHGTAHLFGVRQDDVFAEVHRANMRKVRSTGDADPRSLRASQFDIVKPDGWSPPDVAGILGLSGKIGDTNG